MITLCPLLRVRILDCFRKLKSSSSFGGCIPSLLRPEDAATVLVQVFLDRNNIQNYGLSSLLDVLSLPIVFVECLSLSDNPVDNEGVKILSNFVANCKTIPHRLFLTNSVDTAAIRTIAHGMVHRKNFRCKSNPKELFIGIQSLEQRLVALGLVDDHIECGQAVDDELRPKLMVPMAIMVGPDIDRDAIVSKLLSQLMICNGVDFNYMGHGQCGCNHCAITSSAFDQDDATVNPLDLPMIHLFVDDAAKSKSKAA